MIEVTSGKPDQVELLFRGSLSEEPASLFISHKTEGWSIDSVPFTFASLDEVISQLKNAGTLKRPLTQNDVQSILKKKSLQEDEKLSKLLAYALENKTDYNKMAAAAKQLAEQFGKPNGLKQNEVKNVGEFIIAFGECVARKINK